MIHIIAAVAENGVIGKENDIPWHIPEDLAYFKALTTGHSIIMGRRTFESIGRVLPNRENIIVSTTLKSVDGAVIVQSLKEALQIASSTEVFIIGGARLYQEALPFADVLHITRVHIAPDGDTCFPKVEWELYQETAHAVYDGSADGVPDCTFITYCRK